MNNFGLILRNIVFFLFPVPFLLNFAIEHGKDWTAWVAYTAVVALVLAAVASSPWMRGAPQSGFSMLICRISPRRSASICGRPPRERDFQRQ